MPKNTFQKNGVTVSEKRTLNFVEGAGITITFTDDDLQFDASDFLNVLSYGAVGDGTTDDTAAVAAAVAAASAGETIYFPPGTYLTGQFSINARQRLVGAGKNLSTIKAKTGATGPLINWTNSTLRPGCSIRGLTVDMTNATGIAAVYMEKARNGVIDDLYISPGGTVALQLHDCQEMTVSNVDVYNASTAAFKGTSSTATASSGNTFIKCFSDNTTTTGVYGYFFDGGIDWWLIACKAFRAPGAALDLQYGIACDYTTANNNATIHLWGCSVDAISDRTSDSATVAGILLKQVGNCSVESCFVSAAPSADATANRAIQIDTCNSITISNNYLSGHGIEFTGTATDALKITNNRFYSPDASKGMFVITTTPTNLDARGNSLINGSANLPITDNPTTYYGALTREASVAAGRNLNRSSGALFETVPPWHANTNNTSLTSGTLYLFAVYLPQGLTVTNISWQAGSTALANGGGSPHYWVALYNSSKALLRQSTDVTNATISASAIKTTALSSVFTTTYEGLHYIGVMVNSGGGTQPTMTNFASISALTNLSVVRAATADTALTDTAPNPAGATSNIGNYLYAYVS